jgi:(+)-neomenthol dehydrogenase
LGNVNELTESRLDELLNTFLVDFKEGRLKENGWPDSASAYTMSKAMVSVYTRLIAKGYPEIIANCVCPSYVKTDINYNTGVLSVEEGAKGPVMLALLPDGSPSGQFYYQTEPSSFE